MSKSLTATKVPLEKLIKNLMDLYEQGLDFVDITISNDKVENVPLVIMTATDLYLNPNYKEHELREFNLDDDTLDDLI